MQIKPQWIQLYANIWPPSDLRSSTLNLRSSILNLGGLGGWYFQFQVVDSIQLLFAQYLNISSSRFKICETRSFYKIFFDVATLSTKPEKRYKLGECLRSISVSVCCWSKLSSFRGPPRLSQRANPDRMQYQWQVAKIGIGCGNAGPGTTSL